jgi:hypothetical protein
LSGKLLDKSELRSTGNVDLCFYWVDFLGFVSGAISCASNIIVRGCLRLFICNLFLSREKANYGGGVHNIARAGDVIWAAFYRRVLVIRRIRPSGRELVGVRCRVLFFFCL